MDISNIDVSIIVPVYNVEKYLRRCLESISVQTHSNIEIIVIDDGSSDSCFEICDEYELLDNRVKVLHQKNHGVSFSRNVGIDIASGDYLMFIDSDDYITDNAVEKLLENANEYNLDISYGNFMEINKTEIQSYLFHGQYYHLFSGTDFIKNQLKAGKLYVPVVMGIYKREFIIQNKLYFKNGIVHEDEQWTPLVCIRAKRIRCIKDIFYCIDNGNIESITRRKNREQNGLDMLEICGELEQEFEEIEDVILKKYLMDHIAKLYIFAVMYCDFQTKKYADRLNTKFLIGKAYFLRTRIKVFVFILSKRFYKLLYNRKIR